MAPSIRNRTWSFAFMACLVLAGLVLSLAGDLEPPGPPSPTMESLIRNDDLPMTITVPGSYAFAEDLSTAGGGITISVNNVTIDLRGHVLEGGVGDGITTNVINLTGIVVKNGHIRNWSGDGIDLSSFAPFDSQILHVVADSNLGDGIRVYTGSLVSGCTAKGNTGDGIDAGGGGGTIVDTSTSLNGGSGIISQGGAWSISHCSAILNTQTGIGGLGIGNTIIDCTARDNNGDGLASSGGVIASSSAFSNGDTAGDDGIVALSGTTVVDCTSTSNFEDGIEVSSGSLVRGNTARANGAAGISVTSTGNRIEENNVTSNTGDGINVNPATGNFIIRNSASLNLGIAFDIAAGNSYGLVTAGAAGFSNTNSWANYTF